MGYMNSMIVKPGCSKRLNKAEVLYSKESSEYLRGKKRRMSVKNEHDITSSEPRSEATS